MNRKLGLLSKLLVAVILLSVIPYFGVLNDTHIVYAADITVDNGSSSYSERVGSWSTVNSIGNGGSTVRRSNSSGAAVMYWLPDGSDAGYYTVQIYKVVTVDGDPNAVVGVRHTSGAESYTQDWTTGTSGWVTLGTFYFTPGNADSSVSLVRGKWFNGSGYMTADAVKFIPAPTYTPDPPPTFEEPVPTPPSYVPEGYTLAFQDDFDGTSLDADKWDTFDVTSTNGAYKPSNVTVSGGKLDIAMKKETYGGKSYTSGGVLSKPSMGFGYYEASLKFSGAGSGFHQSFWLYTNLGIRVSSLDSYDEVDIIETNSSHTTSYATNYHDWHWLSSAHGSSGAISVSTPDLSAGYHTFGVLYTDTAIKFYFDGVYQNQVSPSMVSTTIKNRMSILINAVQYETMDDSNLPGHYSVDWVRYFAAPTETPTPGNSVFTDDFEDGNATGWTPVASTWSVVTDGATEVYKQTTAATSGKAYAGNSAWTDYTVEARIKANDLGANSASGILFRYQDTNNYYMFRLHENGYAQLYKVVAGVATLLGQSAQSVNANTWYTLKVVVDGNTINGYVNGTQKIANVTDASLSSGYIGAVSYQQSFSIDDVSVYDASLLADDFEDGNATGWTAAAGTWSVVTDGAGKVYKQSATGTSGWAYAGDSAWTDYTVQARIKANELPTNTASGIVARYTDSNNYYWLRLHQNGYVQLYKVVGGAATLLQQSAQTVSNGTWYTLKLTLSGSSLTGYVNGVQKISATDSSLTNGYAGVRSYQQSFSVDDVQVY